MRKSLIIFIFFLSSCGLLIKQPIYTPVNHNDIIIDTIVNDYFLYSDGTKNFIKSLVVDTSNVIVVCIPGLGAHSGSYSFIQNYLKSVGISSISLDLRGFGHWNKRKGDIKNIGLHIKDINEIITYLKKSYPSKKIILLGESLGSSICLWYAKLFPDKIDGLILTSIVTDFSGGETSLKTVLNLSFSYIFCPSHPVNLDYNPYIYSNDSAFINWAFNIDTLGSNSISPRYLIQAKHLIKDSYSYLCEIKMPIIILQGGKDFLSNKCEIEKLFKDCKTANILYHYYPQMLHSLVNDKNRIKVFIDIKDWICNNYGC